ncbi:cation:dicarboxylase symporter family transporter [Pseudoalteromonas sp. JC3]|uniref:cation:dicarboxylate symporter family transporter n=1 Tax=Pseudoalteromonas sp. JC3 TaxID=2810196 RepID=UPI0019D1DB80|nr:cation:dicarboxylase symporter family transporter [Pseudoalteromonas sp. JC3]MBR8841467.1 cation:dicarboxylase symporter family transporter [Pseudoalteromonas sp. JC3]WJE07489.1 cation:dicarboxylase symporter family transporter [Pseudoalteromonas sp. JC3]
MTKLLNFLKNINWMLWALILGIFAGLVFGERLSFLKPIGTGFVNLMQITILPYIVVSLIVGLGKFNPEQVKSILAKAALVMVSIWVVGLAVIWCFIMTLPAHDAGTFFSPALVAAAPEVDFVKHYIPANPFASMAEGNVPALVIFCIALGMALISNQKKNRLLDVLEVVGQGLSVISKKIIAIFPIGIFAMTASTAGTMSAEELSELQVYWVVVLCVGVYLMLVLLPMLVAALTPVKYRDLIMVMRNAWITAFSTGNVFIVLPVITEGIKDHLRKIKQSDESSDHIAEVLVPIAYTFPSLGKLTTLIFVSFAAWLTGNQIGIEQIPNVSLSAMLSYFANVHIAIPYLLDTLRVPADTYQLYLSMSVLTAKVVSPTTVVYIFAFVFLCIFINRRQLHLKRVRSVYYLTLLSALLPAFMLLSFTANNYLGKQTKSADEAIANMVISDTVPAHVLSYVPKAYQSGELSLTNIDVIKKRNLLRVGYLIDNVPFSYFNQKDQLVGFDVSLAHRLASDLGVKIEFIPFKKPQLAEYLNKGYFDIAMSGLEINIADLQSVRFSDKVLELQLALLAKDHDLKKFADKSALLTLDKLNLAHVEYAPLLKQLAQQNPKVKVSGINNLQSYFKHPEKYDALVISAEAGFAWSMFYPEFGVVVPEGASLKYPVGFAVAKRNQDLLSYVNAWLTIQHTNGRIEKTYDYWILGKGSVQKQTRWSLMDELEIDPNTLIDKLKF